MLVFFASSACLPISFRLRPINCGYNIVIRLQSVVKLMKSGKKCVNEMFLCRVTENTRGNYFYDPELIAWRHARYEFQNENTALHPTTIILLRFGTCHRSFDRYSLLQIVTRAFIAWNIFLLRPVFEPSLISNMRISVINENIEKFNNVWLVIICFH